MRATEEKSEMATLQNEFSLLRMLTIFTIWVVWCYHLLENWNTSTAMLVGLIQIKKSLPEPQNADLTVKNDVFQKKNLAVKELT